MDKDRYPVPEEINRSGSLMISAAAARDLLRPRHFPVFFRRDPEKKGHDKQLSEHAGTERNGRTADSGSASLGSSHSLTLCDRFLESS
jgi:hypothetical protein